jgi:hypothetical protein
MTGATPDRRKRYAKKPTKKNIKRPGVLGERIRPQVSVPEEMRGIVQPNSPPETIQAWNELIEDLHNQAIFAAWDAKLKLLLRHYLLADSDWYGLALILAVEHEAGFQIDHQIAPLPPGFWGRVEIKDGKKIDLLNEAPHPIPPQIARESYRGNPSRRCVFTQPGSFSTDRRWVRDVRFPTDRYQSAE